MLQLLDLPQNDFLGVLFNECHEVIISNECHKVVISNDLLVLILINRAFEFDVFWMTLNLTLMFFDNLNNSHLVTMTIVLIHDKCFSNNLGRVRSTIGIFRYVSPSSGAMAFDISKRYMSSEASI